MKRLFVCFVLFIMCACSALIVMYVSCQSKDIKTLHVVECPMPHCDDNPSLWMSAEACVTMLLDERFERCYVKPYKPDQNVQIGCQGQNCKKVGVVEFLGSASIPPAEKPGEDGKDSPQPSKNDLMLSECLDSDPAVVSVWIEKFGSRQKIKKSEYTFVRNVYEETDDWFFMCLDTMSEFLSDMPGELAQSFPSTKSVPRERVEARLHLMTNQSVGIMLQNIQFDITPSPHFFTRGQEVLGRHNLVENVLDYLSQYEVSLGDFQHGLSLEKLLQWRRRGIREFYAWWKHKWIDPDVRERIRHDLCAVTSHKAPSYDSGLTRKQIERLKCCEIYAQHCKVN